MYAAAQSGKFLFSTFICFTIKIINEINIDYQYYT